MKAPPPVEAPPLGGCPALGGAHAPGGGHASWLRPRPLWRPRLWWRPRPRRRPRLWWRPRPLTPGSLCRLALLQTFEKNITSELKCLQQTCAGLSAMNADILVVVLVWVQVQLGDTGPPTRVSPDLWSCLLELVPQRETASRLLL